MPTGPEPNTDSTGPFFTCYRFCMSVERRKGKEKRKNLTVGVAALGAGLVLGSQIPVKSTDKPAQDDIARILSENPDKYADLEPKGSVIDRRDEPKEIGNAMHFGELEPSPPINDELATSQLAQEAGARDIEKSPIQIMREQKARATQLAKNAREAWLRERNKKQ